MMNLSKRRHRQQLLTRLCEGTRASRRDEAARAWHAIDSALGRVRRCKDQHLVQFHRLKEAMGRPATAGSQAEPEIDPHAQLKARAYGLWPLVLLVEICVAFFTAMATIDGSLAVHAFAGISAAAFLCGISKAAITARIDSTRIESAIRKMERQLVWSCAGAGLLIAFFMIGRFSPWADSVFAATSSGLSFVIAWIVSLAWTLSSLIAAPSKEAARYRRLVELEAELERVQTIAEELCEKSTPEEMPQPTPDPAYEAQQGVRPVAAALVLAFLLFPSLARANGGRAALHLWIDTSGSVDAREYSRIADLLADPMLLLERERFAWLALMPFWDEVHAVQGPPHRWILPTLELPACRAGAASRFTATRRARVELCRKAEKQAQARWRGEIEAVLAQYRVQLATLDVTTDRDRTCLHPVLRRITLSPGNEMHIVVTDGANNCGPIPDEPLSGPATAVIILLPDNGDTGVVDRMRKRAESIKDLYPAARVIQSWQIQGGISEVVNWWTSGKRED